MIRINCNGCGEEIDTRFPVAFVPHVDRPTEYFCDACSDVMAQEAVWQKEHAERSE